MYDPKLDATTDEERYAGPGETIFDHVFHVHEGWKDDPRRGVLTSEDLPAELKRDYPDVFGRFDNESLGTIVKLVWLYLGGKGTVNDRVIRKWFRNAITASPTPSPRGGEGGPRPSLTTSTA